MGEEITVREFREMFESADERHQESVMRLHDRVDKTESAVSEMKGIVSSIEANFKNMKEDITRFYENQLAMMWKWVFFMTGIFAALLGAERVITNFIGK